MFENNYDLNVAPFRLTPDPRFLYAHPGYLKARESMRHSFASGEGVFVLTGRPGIGKSSLIHGFLGELDEDEALCATLSSTNVDGEDLLRMVAYSFGVEAQGLDKPTLLNELHNLLQAHRRALLVIDEAQNLSNSALEEVRMLTNQRSGSRPLLQIFLVGQDRLHDQLHSPEMEQLHQQLVVSCALEPLNLRETRDYILHRLNCVGSLEYPEISPVVFVLVHRYSQGLPRYINQVCTQLLLHGAMEKRQQLEFDDVVSVVQALQRENLMPLINSGSMDSSTGFPPLSDLVRSASQSVEQRLALSPEERDFLAELPVFPKVRHVAFEHRHQPVVNAIDLPQNVQQGTRRYDSGHRYFAYAAVFCFAIVAAYQFGLRGGEPTEKGVLSVSPVMASSEESVPKLKPFSPAVDSRVYRTPLNFKPLARFDYSLELGRILDSITAVPPMIADTPMHTETLLIADTSVQSDPLPVIEKTWLKEPELEASRALSIALEGEIKQLLSLGEDAVASNRLKRPKDKNAWHYYSRVLTLVPGHLDAELGIRQIVTRYGDLIAGEINNKHYRLAQLYINRAMTIAPGDEHIITLQNRLMTDQQALLSGLENDQLLASSNSAVNVSPVEGKVRSGVLLGVITNAFTLEKDSIEGP